MPDVTAQPETSPPRFRLLLDDVIVLAGYRCGAEQLREDRMARESVIDAALMLAQRRCPVGYVDYDQVLLVGAAPAWVYADVSQALCRLAALRRDGRSALLAAILRCRPTAPNARNEHCEITTEDLC